MKPCPCPSCGAPLRGSFDIKDEKTTARPDDFSICTQCVAVLRFNQDLSVRLAAQDDLLLLLPAQRRELAVLQQALRVKKLREIKSN